MYVEVEEGDIEEVVEEVVKGEVFERGEDLVFVDGKILEI
jgi:hypothetical protein